ncbi:MAG: hypothetical protein ACR5LG_13880 [Sodalis sp. (in: enterobacteria)]|uniref:hypothetical protein n=1 Tax=Sodalis sp. (in: enterobacteria) TaxID=1898979 RepID=UPI003F37D26B
MLGRSRCRNVGARVRRLCLETGFTLLAIELALFIAGLLLWLLGVDPLAYYGFIVRNGLLASAGWQVALTRTGPLLLIVASLMVARIWAAPDSLCWARYCPRPSHRRCYFATFSWGSPCLWRCWPGCWAEYCGALLPAILKIWRNINEIITSLMMSFLGVSLANVLVKLLLADPATTVPQTCNLSWEQRLLMLFGGYVSSGLLLGLLAVLAGAVEIIAIQNNVRADWNPAYILVIVPLVFLV